MIRKQEPAVSKQQIISEYLTGDQSFKALSTKYGVNGRTIQTWVRAFRRLDNATGLPLSKEDSPELKALKKQLQQAELKNELLEEILRLSEEQTGIDLRKKFGAGQ